MHGVLHGGHVVHREFLVSCPRIDELCAWLSSCCYWWVLMDIQVVSLAELVAGRRGGSALGNMTVKPGFVS